VKAAIGRSTERHRRAVVGARQCGGCNVGESGKRGESLQPHFCGEQRIYSTTTQIAFRADVLTWFTFPTFPTFPAAGALTRLTSVAARHPSRKIALFSAES
jgi:hypothetical protein